MSRYKKPRPIAPAEIKLGLFLANGIEIKTHEAIFDRLWGHDPGGGPEAPRKQVQLYVHRLRGALAHYGVSILTFHGTGYGIEHKQRGRAIAALHDLQHLRGYDRSKHFQHSEAAR